MKKVISRICLMIVLHTLFTLMIGCNGKNNPIIADEPPLILSEEIPDWHFIHLDNGKFMNEIQPDKLRITKRDDITTIFEKIEQNTVVVYFHGGLVDAKNAFTKPMKKVGGVGFNKSMYDIFEDKDEVTEKEGAYPIFFVWRSGFLDTLRNMPRDRTQETYFTDETKKLILKLNRKEKPESLIEEFLSSFRIDSKTLYTDLPENLLDEYYKVYESWDPDKQKELTKALNDGIQNTTEELNQFLRDNPGIEEQVWGAESVTAEQKRLFGKYLSWFKVKLLYPVIKRRLNGRHHGFKATMQEEIYNSTIIGKTHIGNFIKDGWGTMKCITANAFQDDDTKYGGTAFLKELNNLVLQKPHTRVILIGHSTGAEYICNLLENAARADKYPWLASFKFDVIFEAPACTFERFNKTLDIAGKKIRHFRMFALGDKFEKDDKVGHDVVYSRSMLYYVSSVAEPTRHDSNLSDKCKLDNKPPYEYHDKPILGMERYFKHSKFDRVYDEVRRVKLFMEYVDKNKKGKIAFSKIEEKDGWKITAKTHVECDDNAELLKSLQHIIKFGFETNEK